MSQSYYLYCEATGEAVITLRHGNGITPPGGYSNKVLFSFLAHHFRKYEKTLDGGCNQFATVNLDNLEDNYHIVTSLEEMAEIRERLEGLEKDLKFVLIWEEDNLEQLMGREHEEQNELSGWKFGKVTKD
jgi:hypothetical protein